MKMNERIEELANQVDACYIPRYDMWQMDTETMKKFAELIVKECAEFASTLFECGFDDKMPEYVAGQIKEHFGVEE